MSSWRPLDAAPIPRSLCFPSGSRRTPGLTRHSFYTTPSPADVKH